MTKEETLRQLKIRDLGRCVNPHHKYDSKHLKQLEKEGLIKLTYRANGILKEARVSST